MKIRLQPLHIILAILSIFLLCGGRAVRLDGKEKNPAVSPDDVTLRLYQLLDSAYGGKLVDFFVVADTFKDPKTSEQEREHILKVEYEKDRAFGKLRVYVRTVDKLTPEQQKAYTTKQIFEYAEEDAEKFSKTDPGIFGRPGDIYLRPVSEGGPLTSVPVTDDARNAYQRLIADYVLPALQKK